MLRTVVADRPEDLLDELVAALREPLDDGSVASLFTPEWVSVPSLGMATWVRGQLSRRLGAGALHDGISANIEYPFPGVLRWAILDAHRLAADPTAELADPWRVDRLVWSVLEVLSDPPGDLDDRLTLRGTGVTLAGRAGPLADLFDQYVVHRPQMVLDWLDGRDVGADGSAIDPARAWQPALFRAVQRHIAERHGITATPAERLVDALDRLRAGTLDLGPGAPRPVPPRLFVAGQSLITAELGPVLSALAEHRDVTLLMLSPSARTSVEMAERTAAQRHRPPARAASWAIERGVHPAAPVSTHPLLATWAQRPIESAVLLGVGGAEPELAGPPPAEPADLLGRLQRDLHDGAIGEQPFVPTERDRSVQLHGTPGRTRQVEALRDTILGLLRDDPTLTEADVVVLCPALDEFAPVLTAVLGPTAGRGDQPAPDTVPALRYAVVDRSARSFNPVLDALAALLELLPGRFDATAVRGFLALPAVRERFGLSAEDLALAADWTDETRVRWGLDDRHRRRWDVEGDAGNSWQTALDGLLMGVALGDDLRDTALPGVGAPPDPTAAYALAPGGVAPMSLADGDLAAAGRLAAALRSLAAAHSRLVERGVRPVAEWLDDLTATLDDLVAAPRFEDWQRSAVDELLTGLVAASAAGVGNDPEPSRVLLQLADVRRLLAPSLEGGRARADLGYGSVVVARPSLLQSVPHRVVCVLGLDSDALPAGRNPGDDLLRHAPMVGDRDARAEARAELLAAITSARDTLVVTFNSTDVRTNTKVPEAVVLDELVEVLATTLGVTTDQLRASHSSAQVVHHHPRQAFDPANFGGGPHRDPVGFDPVALEGARALHQPRHERSGDTTLLAAPLPVRPAATTIELADLRDFYRHPVRSFFRTRLDVVAPRIDEAPDDELPPRWRWRDSTGHGSVHSSSGSEWRAAGSTGWPTVPAAARRTSAPCSTQPAPAACCRPSRWPPSSSTRSAPSPRCSSRPPSASACVARRPTPSPSTSPCPVGCDSSARPRTASTATARARSASATAARSRTAASTSPSICSRPPWPTRRPSVVPC